MAVIGAIEMKTWKIIARNKIHVNGATITESEKIDSPTSVRRFTATIRGFQNWRIWQGETAYKPMEPRVKEIKRRVEKIRDRIDRGDESVFSEKGAW